MKRFCALSSVGLSFFLALTGVAAEPLTYTVKPGDTLSDIASENKVPLAQLLQVNPQISDPDLIRVGTMVYLQARKKEATPVTPIKSPVTKSPKPVPIIAPSTTKAPRLFAYFNPKDRGLPGNREGAAVRGGCLKPSTPNLVAFLPANAAGLTLAARPTFYWLMPEVAVPQATLLFRLVAVNSDKQDLETVYETDLPLSAGGIRSFTLPPEVPGLMVGQDYRWLVALSCRPDDPSSKIFVAGWVQRVTPSEPLSQELAQAELKDYPAVYGEAGLWYDALKSLVLLRQREPADPRLQEDWTKLLAGAGLEQWATASLVP